jgi:hypothetical protein
MTSLGGAVFELQLRHWQSSAVSPDEGVRRSGHLEDDGAILHGNFRIIEKF